MEVAIKINGTKEMSLNPETPQQTEAKVLFTFKVV